jgi:hypothetical protein
MRPADFEFTREPNEQITRMVLASGLAIDPRSHRRQSWKLEPVENGMGTSLGRYLVCCPGLHAAWEYWLIGVVHLRDEPGLPPADNHHSHELMVAAIEPRDGIDPDVRETLKIMQPLDVVHQFTVGSDAIAVGLLDELVRMVCRFELHPDSDFRSTWPGAVDYACTLLGKLAT